MLKFNPNTDSDDLDDQFNLPKGSIEGIEELWNEVFKEIESSMEEGIIDESETKATFDARKSMQIFFSKFDTDEKQGIALIQLLMRDIANRAEQRLAQRSTMQAFEAMMEKMRRELGDTGGDDLDELI